MESAYSPLSSILKSSSLNSEKKNVGQVRFETKPNTNSLDVITILKDYIDGRNDARYSQLLGLKKDPNVNVSFMGLVFFHRNVLKLFRCLRRMHS